MYTVKNIRFEDKSVNSKEAEEDSPKYRDEYKRKKIAENILKLIGDSNNSPLFIDGAWGSGKSEFCYKLYHYLKDSNNGIKESHDSKKLIVSYINCFAGDYQQKPFMLIVQAIYNCLVAKSDDLDIVSTIKEKLASSMDIIQKLATSIPKATTLKIGHSAIGGEIEVDFGKVVDEIKTVNDESFKRAFFDELEDFKNQSDQLKRFKQAIAELIGDKKIVLIIDELDRCRPDYALELLENIKHIFDIKGLFIIFSANKSQLGSMIRKKYGYDIDAEEYLEKFYQKETILSSAVPASDSINGAQGTAEHLSVFCANLKNHTRNDGGQWTVSEVNNYPFVRDILGTMQTRRLEKVANYLNAYSESVGIPLQNYNETKIPLIILGVFILVSNKSLLIGIENEYAQSRLIKFLEQLEIGGDAKSIMMSAVRDDLKIIGNIRDFSPIYQQFQSGSMMLKVATTFLI